MPRKPAKELGEGPMDLATQLQMYFAASQVKKK
jgi:hypothetical protein